VIGGSDRGGAVIVGKHIGGTKWNIFEPFKHEHISKELKEIE
jgi:hypothetical protein